jgi:hypothetical protein
MIPIGAPSVTDYRLVSFKPTARLRPGRDRHSDRHADGVDDPPFLLPITDTGATRAGCNSAWTRCADKATNRANLSSKF